jgi:hypothetical protein
VKIVANNDGEDVADVDPVELGKRAARDHRPHVRCLVADAFRVADPVLGVILFGRRSIPDFNRRLPS